MGVLVRTLEAAFGEMAHFVILFMVLFMFLAYMAHFQFADQLIEYDTIWNSSYSQFRMVFGEFLYTTPLVGTLHGAQLALYWLYALTFFALAFLILLNFL